MSTRDGNKSSQRKGINHSNGSVTRNHHNTAGSSTGVARSCGFMVCRRSDFLPVRILKHLGGKVAEGVRFVSLKIRPSPKVSSSGRSKPFVTPVDTHRTEAIEDCIEFINSSSSLPRSNSRSANPH